jgi:hypothetical protein
MRKRIDPKLILLAALRGEEIPPGRYKNITYCRFIWARHLRLQGLGLEEIGNRLNKDHATVSYYDRKYDENYRFNPEFRELADWFNIVKEEM